MNVFIQNAKSGEKQVAFLLGALDFDTIISLEYEDGSVTKGIMTFTPDGEIVYTNMMKYDAWNVIGIIASEY